MALNNILDLISQGFKDANPVYRDRQKVLQEQLFRQQQDEYNRTTPTWFEKQAVDRQKGLDKTAESDRQDKFMEHTAELESKGILQRVDKNRQDINPDGSPVTPPEATPTPATPSPAATGPGDATTNGGPSGAANTAAPGFMGMDITREGALQPTSATAPNAASGGSTPSGGGPSAPPVASLLGLPQGPLTGGVGAAPTGNALATTDASRASSAQAGPLAQIQQGSTSPSQTAAGQTGSGSGPLPSPAQKATGAPDLSSPDGNIHYRFTNSDEQVQRQARQAQQIAKAQRDLKTANLNGWLAKNPDMNQDPDTVKALTLENETGLKMPEVTLQRTEGKLMAKAASQMAAGQKDAARETMNLLSELHQRQTPNPTTLMINSKGETAATGIDPNTQQPRVFPPGEGWHPVNQSATGRGQWYAVPDGNGGYTNRLIGDSETIPSGARIASQIGPTSQTRSMTEQAALVDPQIVRTMREIDDNRDKLGPLMGKAQGFYVNKMGAEGPAFAGLDSDLDFAASALLKPHFGGRIPVQVLDDMKSHLKESQSPDDLLARLQQYHSWLTGYASANKGKDMMSTYKEDPLREAYETMGRNTASSTDVKPPPETKTAHIYKSYSTGPNGHRIGSDDFDKSKAGTKDDNSHWFDAATGKAL